MSNFPSSSKSAEPVAIASSSGSKNKNILPKPSSQTSAVPPDSHDSSGFTIVKRKKKPKISSKNKISTVKTTNSTSDSSEGNSSDTDSDITVTSAPEVSNTQKNRARSKSEKSKKLKQAKRGLSQKDLPAKLKKNCSPQFRRFGTRGSGCTPQGPAVHFWWRAPCPQSQTSSIR
ncbi:hypothetical protein AVEN_194445-1 [Araneus ventricosus]|uniref:Uncharacterized protein n=1 Tax=Araneus ventricosus TaxID=182803 RepID=A0A4Y2A6K3_ARAVE|nr:hypothetical protein AVEN_194445-1 [Araneus ventricosus]